MRPLLLALVGCRGELAEDMSWSLEHEIGSLVTVRWQQLREGETWVELAVDDDDWRSTPVRSLGEGAQSELLLGVPYDHDVRFRLAGPDWTSDEQVATTEPLPEGLPTAELLVDEPDLWGDDGDWLFTSLFHEMGGGWRVIVDHQGRTVWAQDNVAGSQTLWSRVAMSGSELLWDDTFLFTPDQSGVHRIKIDGSEVEWLDMPYLLHAYDELDDGSFAYGNFEDIFSEKLTIRGTDGTFTDLWDCKPFMEEWGATEDGCLSNTVSWDRDSDTILYSFFTTMTVVQIDRQTGETLNSWGRLSDWSFDPPESQFDWQHGVTLTDEGHLLLSTHVSLDSWEAVVREYELDEDAKALRQVWSFAEGDGIEARHFGEARRLASGNTLHNYGSTPRLRVATPQGEVAWDLSWEESADDKTLIGRSVLLDDLYAFAP